MTRIFVRHNVADYKVWRKAYDDFDGERKALGVTAHAVFQSVDDPNDVTVWHDFSTPQSAKDFASSARLKEVMGKAGVKGAPQIWFVSQANWFGVPRTLQAQECRERALECARKAQESTDPAARSMFAELAQQWFRLAEMLEDRPPNRQNWMPARFPRPWSVEELDARVRALVE
jgi:hypothetical protein